MRSIFEAKEMKLSKDFELIGSGQKTDIAKKFLKKLDDRVEELGLSYDKCREAALMMKRGNFENALKSIWGKNNVDVSSEHFDDGATETYTYEVKGYATFKEKIVRHKDIYAHTITATYVDVPNPSKALGTIIEVYLKSNSTEFESMQELANKNAFLKRSTAAIYNILFVAMDGYDMSSVLSRYHLKIKNKLMK